MWRAVVYCLLLYEKDNNINCSIDWDTTLFSTTYKILSNIFASSLTWYVEGIYWDWQCGFQRNRSTTDKILCFVDRASRYIRVMKTNLLRYLSSVHFVSQPLHVSGISVFHHQEVYCIYTALVRLVLFSWQSVGRPTGSQLKSPIRTSAVYIQYTSWWWTTDIPETCRCWLTK